MTPAESTSTRDAILEASADLFVENGYHGTSMRQIAARAGVALGGIYNHFPGKESIFSAVIRARHPINALLPVLSEAEGHTAEALLRDGARRMLTAMGQDRRLLRLIFVELVEFDGRHIGQLLDDLYPTALSFLQQLTRPENRLRPLPPLVVMRTFFGAVFSHAILDMLLADTPLTADPAAADHLVDILLYGLLERGQTMTEE